MYVYIPHHKEWLIALGICMPVVVIIFMAIVDKIRSWYKRRGKKSEDK